MMRGFPSLTHLRAAFKERRYFYGSHFILQVGCINMYVSVCNLVSESPLP